ncbi:tRNA (adenosine(37)-N6)-threonylcarbamoyltransferase complex transferase subunit TsaD [Staphylococcus pseudintermedius]|uniref:tRNA (adenosine(37)-N6)-threonylcarbamoyltransferase complex transferase subunit TsaD n=1 Tax=Staphylococcus pseudintermedius TaxID=283734 RepID=UPI001036D7E7|nr:tRNA (adenosine(37)-N6)-threonylcarbamoyltransferase complex transferase subunit TsaD [Staphylococcus pseudintermedius]EGQ1309506.1 tRNA (adenosine(37)-N6)-threonylcarbamoyltransferase complex transferase subunit TsaD [Staphylococcus pseudintermedius]EGQ2751894.1 tRNA (adenosine(37)-N6)-threonylcarbamoyltransferase complex transferase subunit TsaD [Staphylococcus pseudintermedius]EGQ2917787.1 tRNA (adenosine(37)-N6)-threonylcarbamoyltransferase complex transferase subunit TsaD [Staphylococcus
MNEQTKILALETSCDETSVSVIENGQTILSNSVLSQIESHQRFGGVVPEVASRHHVENITVMIEEALQQAHTSIEDVDAVAVTQGPGLIGALLVGVNAAKALAFANDKPLIPVHHIAGHVYANQLQSGLKFPLIALIVSGGHTELVYMENHLQFEVIGETRDDAVGEAYDKVARKIGLPYPGGPAIDRLAAQGEDTYDFPRVWLEPDSYDFSFSGLKSAVINKLHQLEQKGDPIIPENVATSFQNSVVEVLVGKAMRACEAYGVKQLIVAGGVASNRGLRHALEVATAEKGIELAIPELKLCTDNAAMIGAAAHEIYLKGIRGDMALNGQSSMDIEMYRD